VARRPLLRVQVISGDGERITCPNDDMTMTGC
jgi:hypothetical protein